MSPAFSSPKQAGAFALLLLVLLVLPTVMKKDWLPPRQQIYACLGWDTTGPHPYHYQQIFEEKGDIDIAFVGSSRILHGIDTPYVQERLSEKLGRQAVVRTIAWGGAGFDVLYVTMQDLLQNRKVHMFVLDDESQAFNVPNSLAPYWFRFGDNAEALQGLPLQIQAVYYFASIIGMPRNLLGLARPDFPAEVFSSKKNASEIIDNAENPALRLGSIASKLGFNTSLIYNDYKPFVAFTPRTGVSPADVCIYSPETKNKFEFPGPPTPAWQIHFARKFTELAREHQCRLALLHLPLFSEIRAPVIRERDFWPDALQADVTMVGIPPATLFAGMGVEDARLLFDDTLHLNKNGQDFFTPLVTPALLQTYDSKTQH
jgi:hypothetical protein